MKIDNQLKNRVNDSGDTFKLFNEKTAALMTVFNEARALFYRGGVTVQQIHRQGPLTDGKRGILMSLIEFGEQTGFSNELAGSECSKGDRLGNQ